LARVPVVKATNLTKEFQLGAVDVTAIEGVNLEIYSGEFIIFFGPSGCGKSTLMSLLAGLQPPSKGKILVRGEDLAAMNADQLAKHRRTKIGMVFQSFNLITSMNVLENIALPLTFDRIPRSRRLTRAENLLETVGMSEYKNHTPGELSGGQQQRIALARSLVTNPWIILADEPTGNLDSKSADDVMRLLIKLNRKSKRTVILITHNPDYTVYADRIFHVKDGRIVDVEVNSNVKMDIVKGADTTDKKGKKEKATKTKKSKKDKEVKIENTKSEEVAPDEASSDIAPESVTAEEAPETKSDVPTDVASDVAPEDALPEDVATEIKETKKEDKKLKVMRLGK
jgi:putative ABC transport system ATP-binding protein